MKPVIEMNGARVFHGSNLDVLPTLPDNSVDSIVTDPPYELGFMGKSWDSSGIAYSVELWTECMRVLKPGGHLLAFGGSRTWHRLAVAIEDAGFEMRDSIAWLYGSGFPKSMDVSKAIDKAAGAEREILDTYQRSGRSGGILGKETEITRDITAPATDEAQKWQGWGTALKPAFEPVVVARKPFKGTVAGNVLEWGVGGLNIDGSRIGKAEDKKHPGTRKYLAGTMAGGINGGGENQVVAPYTSGRWPANIILDPYTAELLDEQSGQSVSKRADRGSGKKETQTFGVYGDDLEPVRGHNDSGGASRFFYVAKASKRDRNEGLEGLDAVRHSDRSNADGVGGDNPCNRTNKAKQNFHPTVKPTTLMEYLIKLVTPEGGTVLDPFTGSGSTGKAALLNGFQFIGIELTEEYLPIIERRLKWANEQREAQQTIDTIAQAEKLF
jgi:site-specific DNA-methyltransferase (adenine-specific)